MREDLKKINGLRMQFIGRFVRFGQKNGYKGPLPTLLLQDVKMVGAPDIKTDHLWFNVTKRFAALDLKEGDMVLFDARVTEYLKGYQGYKEDAQYDKPVQVDFKLSHPTNVRKSVGRLI